jgi:hypothetical protein
MAESRAERRLPVLVLVSLFWIACDGSRRKVPAEVNPAMKTPTFEGTRASSFSYAYASSLRNSQVFVARKSLRSIVRRPIDHSSRNGSEHQPPFALVVSPDARHAILSSRFENEILTDAGYVGSGLAGDAVAFDECFFLYGWAQTWNLEPLDEHHATGTALARRIEGDHYAGVTKLSQEVDPPRPRLLKIEGGRRHPRYTGDGLDWSRALPDRDGIAAIGGDWSVVVALDNQLLQIYAPVPDERGLARLITEANIGVRARWLSLVRSEILVVASEGTESRLLAFSSDAKPLYSLTVPFEVLAPPIAGAGSRVYLAGRGLAAIDGGKISFTHLSSDSVFATAFEDGSLAVATGKRLDLMSLDGRVDQTFPTNEVLVAPPAIAGDSSVWVASDRAVYIVR